MSNLFTLFRVRNPVWLVALPAAVCLSDVGLTLHGQDAVYWQGDYSDVNEGNPVPRFFLEWHPLAFLALAVVWIACFVIVILLAPRRWAVCLSLALVLGHTVGTCSWLVRLGRYGPWLAVAFLLATIPFARPIWRARRKP